MNKVRTIREPGLTLDVHGATIIGGTRLSAMPAVITEVSPTLAGSVRGAKPEVEDPPSGTVKRRPMTKIVRAVLRTTRDTW
jgi:hypothetical protein